LPKNSVLGDNKRFGLVVTNSKNSVNTFFFLFFAFRIILHIIKKSQKKKFAQRNSLWKFSQKFTHFFLSCTHLLRQLSFFLCVLNLAEWIEKKLRFFRAGITALVAKAFWQWISKIHYFKGRTKPKIKGIISFFLCKVEGGVEGEDLYCNFSNFENLIEDSFDFF